MLSNRAAAVFDRCFRYAQLAWPGACVLCGAGVAARQGSRPRFCTPCEASLPRLPERRCEVCALPLASGKICGACLADAPEYDAVASSCGYAFPVDALIQRYKYGGDLTLAPALSALLIDAAAPRVDLIVAMPLSRARLRSRGFNQAQELARHVARRLRIPLAADAVRKIADTPPQATLPWKARARNVRGAFVCDADLTGKHVAVVDDVMTTGATLNELARNLKAAGAAKVTGWIVARTLREDP